MKFKLFIKFYHYLGSRYPFLERRIAKEAIAYTLVGLLGTAIDFASFYFFRLRGLQILIAQWLAAFLGFSHNHLWQHFWIFDHNRRLGVTYPLSLVIALLVVAASAPVLVALDAVVGNIWISKFIVAAATAVFLFSARKFFIFVKK